MYIAIDMGGTNIRVAATDNLDNPQIKDKLVFKNDHDFDGYTDKIAGFCTKQGKISAIGISTNGYLNKEKTFITGDLKNTPEKFKKPIVDILKNGLNCEVVMENDGVAAAMGEIKYGYKNLDEFIYIIWGSGIGGSITLHLNGNLKIKPIDWVEYLESWENECGGKALEKKFGKPVWELTEENWQVVMNNFQKHLEEFLDRVKTGHIIFGGGIAVNNFERIKAIREKSDAKLPELLLTNFGGDAGLYGAFALINFS